MIHGTCSHCGGAVTTPAVWHGVNPPIPSCVSCGGHPASPYGPIIEISPPTDTKKLLLETPSN